MTTLKPPFRAEDMNGLFKRVIKGSYPKIGDAYSKQLASVIKSLLQVNPDNRPDASQLLHSLKSKADELGTELGTFVPNQQLLQTIRVNKNLHYLTERMPMSNYENGHEVVRSHKSSKQTKIVANGQQSMNISNVRSINLPRLDRIVLRQNNHKLSVSEPRKHEGALEGKSLENLLKIEGKGSHHVHDYAYK